MKSTVKVGVRLDISMGRGHSHKSGRNGSANSGGKRRDLSMALMLQYRMLIRTSKGVEHTERTFLMPKSRGLRVRSANRPKANVAVAKASPMMAVPLVSLFPFHPLVWNVMY